MQLWNLQSNEKTRAKRKLKGSTPEGSDPKDSPTTTTTTTCHQILLHNTGRAPDDPKFTQCWGGAFIFWGYFCPENAEKNYNSSQIQRIHRATLPLWLSPSTSHQGSMKRPNL